MSSFQLSENEFQLIADWLCMQADSKHSKHAFCIKTFIGFKAGTVEHHTATGEQTQEYVKYFVRKLYDLNRLALTVCYGDKYDSRDDKYFIPMYNPMVNEKKAIQALQSLRYQCGEYIVMETDCYKNLNLLIGSLCENIFKRENPLYVDNE